MLKRMITRICLFICICFFIDSFIVCISVNAKTMSLDEFLKKVSSDSVISKDLVIEFENMYNSMEKSRQDSINLDKLYEQIDSLSKFINENNYNSINDENRTKIMEYASKICDSIGVKISIATDGNIRISDGDRCFFHTSKELSKSLFEDNKHCLDNCIKETGLLDKVSFSIETFIRCLLSVGLFLICFLIFWSIKKKVSYVNLLKKLVRNMYIPIIFVGFGMGLFMIIANKKIEPFKLYSNMSYSSQLSDCNVKLGDIYKRQDFDENDNELLSIAKSNIKWPQYGDRYATISSKKIGLYQNLYMGDCNKILQKGVGQYYGSSLPGMGRKIIIGGHNASYFSNLAYIKQDDSIVISTNYGEFEYKVVDIDICEKDIKSYVDNIPDNEESLILYTCYPFEMLANDYNKRYFVVAKKEKGPNILNIETFDNNENNKYKPYDNDKEKMNNKEKINRRPIL